VLRGLQNARKSLTYRGIAEWRAIMLTTGIDTMPGLVGSANSSGTDGNDTIVALINKAAGATNTTLNALDTINGGLGTNSMTLTVTGGNLAAADFNAVTISNVQTLNVRGTDNLVMDLPANAGITGITALNTTLSAVTNLTAATTTDVSVSGATGAITTDGGRNITVTDTFAGNNITIGEGTVNAGTVTVTDNIAAARIEVDGGTTVSITATGATNLLGNAIRVGAGGAATDQPSGAVTVSNTAAAIVANAGAATAVQMGNIAVTGGSTVSVTQSANAGNGVADNVGDVITQGAVTVTGGNTTTSVTVVQDDQVAAGVAAVAGTAGVNQTQTVTFSAMTANQSVTVNGLQFTATRALTANEVAQAFANLTNGDRQDDGGPTANGFYSGQNNTLAYTSGAANGATVTYTAVAQAANTAALTVLGAAGATAPVVAQGTNGVVAVAAVAGVVGVANGAVVINEGGTASIATIVVDGYGANATLGGGGSLNALQHLTLKNSGAGIATLTSTSTTLNVTLDDVDAAVNLGANVRTLTVNTEGTASTGAVNAAGATAVTINAGAALTTVGGFNAATTITVNGAAAVNLTGSNFAALTALNAGANTGGLTADVSTRAAAVVTGSSAADVITFGPATVASNLGEGNDTAIINQNALGAGGAVDGGDGIDTLSMGFANAVAASGNTQFDLAVTNFERLLINNVANNADATADTFTVNLANLTYDYVTVNGTDNGVNTVDTLALTGMAANGTVAIGGLSTANSLYTVALANAAGTTDVLNLVMNAADNGNNATPAALNGGTVTANGVETFNIASTTVDPNGATNTISTVGNAVTTINVTGNATLALTAANATLTRVDASAMTAGGLQFTVANASSTVIGGAGADVITVNATADSSTINGGAGNDTFLIAAGADLVTLNGGAGADTFDFNGVSTNKSNFVVIQGVDSGDTLDFAGLVDVAPVTTFTAARITLSVGATESTQAYLDQAMTTLAENGFGWFQFNGNTYIAGDVGGADSLNAFADGADFVVMITGLVDLSTASFNSTSATLEIA
jgi:hypothetical protein